MSIRDDLQQRLDAFIADSPCPGAALGVVVDGELTAVAAGTLNVDVGYPATTDSLFQIGSVTKLWTATLVMQLVEEGLVGLDDPVRTHLPGFALDHPDRAERVTVRHLLTHTSGIEGDVFTDVGGDDDALTRYVAAMADVGVAQDLEETWSYCNAGWVVLGRLVEVARGTTFEAAMRTHLTEPLQLGPVATRAGQAILHRVAVGHDIDHATGALTTAPVWSMPQALLPAGLVTCSVRSLLGFARMHLEEGRAGDGTPVLAPQTVALMHTPQVECPEVEKLADSWGLGFWVKHWGEHVVVGHGGNTIGQAAYLDMVPAEGVAVALLTNVGGAAREATDLVKGLLADLAGVDTPSFPSLPSTPADVPLQPHVGRYSRVGVDYDVELVDGTLLLTVHPGEYDRSMGATSQTSRLVPVGEGAFLAAPDPEHVVAKPPVPVRFHGGDGTAFLQMGGRATPRVG